MASKEDRHGLLSKVAMFVRNPTKDWSELDEPLNSDTSGYDKKALKAMIERKRQNDFVRKREFDHLRKLRNRDPGALANMANPSFFQTSLPADLDGRAVTLKKIDEIEAQMSRQWWKNKAEKGGAQHGDAPRPDMSGASVPANAKESPDVATSFASTMPLDLRQGSDSQHADEFLPTQMASANGENMLAATESLSDARTGFSTSRLFAIGVDEMATDPELEEAAIRFATGDDAGAENGLLEALRGSDVTPLAAQSWVAALLDFYRTGNQRAAFDAALVEFALHLNGANPIWSPLGAPITTASLSTRTWDSPAILTAQAMKSLRTAMQSKPMPWYLGWGDLEKIATDAIPLLDALFASLCEEEIILRFDGEDHLISALVALTPSGEGNVPPGSWQTRLNALRTMRLQDEFELAALDYCVSLGVAPPPWVEARCRIAVSGMVAGAGSAATYAGSKTVPMGAEVGLAPDAAGLVLQGEILGDAIQALAALDAAVGTSNRMLIACDGLVRVDFPAAGSILNWVAMRQAEGKHLQFQNVHRLVAAFFNVIGINEHAQVIPRPV